MTDKRVKEPCPFCGTKADKIEIVTVGVRAYRIHCPKCSAGFLGCGGKQYLIDKWNGRYRE